MTNDERNPNRNKAKTQCEMIIEHLQAGNSLTQLEALRKFGVYALSQRIGNLKRDGGYDIVSQTIKTETGKHVAQYFMREFSSKFMIEKPKKKAMIYEFSEVCIAGVNHLDAATHLLALVDKTQRVLKHTCKYHISKISYVVASEPLMVKSIKKVANDFKVAICCVVSLEDKYYCDIQEADVTTYSIGAIFCTPDRFKFVIDGNFSYRQYSDGDIDGIRPYDVIMLAEAAGVKAVAFSHTENRYPVFVAQSQRLLLRDFTEMPVQLSFWDRILGRRKEQSKQLVHD